MRFYLVSSRFDQKYVSEAYNTPASPNKTLSKQPNIIHWHVHENRSKQPPILDAGMQNIHFVVWLVVVMLYELFDLGQLGWNVVDFV